MILHTERRLRERLRAATGYVPQGIQEAGRKDDGGVCGVMAAKQMDVHDI